MSTDENKAIARAYLTHAIGEGNFNIIDAYVAYEPGKQFAMQMITWLRTVFPDLDRIAGGKVVEMWHEVDRWGMREQLEAARRKGPPSVLYRAMRPDIAAR